MTDYVAAARQLARETARRREEEQRARAAERVRCVRQAIATLEQSRQAVCTAALAGIFDAPDTEPAFADLVWQFTEAPRIEVDGDLSRYRVVGREPELTTTFQGVPVSATVYGEDDPHVVLSVEKRGNSRGVKDRLGFGEAAEWLYPEGDEDDEPVWVP